MHTIQHTVLRKFWPIALEKPTRGKPVSEREIFIISSRKILESHLRSKYSLSQPKKMTQQDASISMQMLSRFLCLSFSKNVPKITATFSLDFCARMIDSALDFCAKTTTKTVLYGQY